MATPNANTRPVRLENGFVLALDEAGTAGCFSIVIENGRVAALGTTQDLRESHAHADPFDCSGCIVMPGLVNAHLHAEMIVLKGLVEEMDLHAWETADDYNRSVRRLSAPAMDWVQRAAIRASLADALLGGTTLVALYGLTAGADDIAVETLREFGMPGHVTVRDTEFSPLGARPATELDPPRMYRLHAEEALTHEELEAAARAHARGERIVMHAAETPWRVGFAHRRFGATTVRLLERYGLLSPRMLLSHAVHVDEEERDLLRQHGACILSSPAAELKLGDGIAPIADYLALGLTVAIGTDAAICNNSNDMFLECRVLGLSQKARSGASVLPAEQILHCATRHGARALGDATRGTLEPGRAADLILIDTRNARLQPLVHHNGFSNVAANLVYATTGQDVRDVMIGGRWVVRDRRLQVADADALWAELGRAARVLHER